MTDHDALTLMALRIRTRGRVEVAVFDTDVLSTGRRRFGQGWSMVKQGRSVGYAPLVSMSLGRLAAQGLVERAHRSRGLQSYCAWRLTEAGAELAAELLGGSKEDLS